MLDLLRCAQTGAFNGEQIRPTATIVRLLRVRTLCNNAKPNKFTFSSAVWSINGSQSTTLPGLGFALGGLEEIDAENHDQRFQRMPEAGVDRHEIVDQRQK
jgi:hypothetical protein